MAVDLCDPPLKDPDSIQPNVVADLKNQYDEDDWLLFPLPSVGSLSDDFLNAGEASCDFGTVVYEEYYSPVLKDAFGNDIFTDLVYVDNEEDNTEDLVIRASSLSEWTSPRYIESAKRSKVCKIPAAEEEDGDDDDLPCDLLVPGEHQYTDDDFDCQEAWHMRKAIGDRNRQGKARHQRTCNRYREPKKSVTHRISSSSRQSSWTQEVVHTAQGCNDANTAEELKVCKICKYQKPEDMFSYSQSMLASGSSCVGCLGAQEVVVRKRGKKVRTRKDSKGNKRTDFTVKPKTEEKWSPHKYVRRLRHPLGSFESLRQELFFKHSTKMAMSFTCITGLSIAPVYKDVQDQFMNKVSGHELTMAWHGTPLSNYPSIMKNGLRVPGSKSGVKVANGSAYGVGIYLAQESETSLYYTKGCESMLYCAVAPSMPDVTTQGGVHVAFDDHLAIPMFVVEFSSYVQTISCKRFLNAV